MVSKACLGTMTWGEQNSDEEAFEQCNMAFHDFGVNFIVRTCRYLLLLFLMRMMLALLLCCCAAVDASAKVTLCRRIYAGVERVWMLGWHCTSFSNQLSSGAPIERDKYVKQRCCCSRFRGKNYERCPSLHTCLFALKLTVTYCVTRNRMLPKYPPS